MTERYTAIPENPIIKQQPEASAREHVNHDRQASYTASAGQTRGNTGLPPLEQIRRFRETRRREWRVKHPQTWEDVQRTAAFVERFNERLEKLFEKMQQQTQEEGGNEHRLHRHSGGVDPRRNRIGIAVSAPLTTWSGRRDTSLCHAPLRTGQASRPAPRPKPMSSCSAVIWGSTNVAFCCTMGLLRPPYTGAKKWLRFRDIPPASVYPPVQCCL
jgi:hypothetical protein